MLRFYLYIKWCCWYFLVDSRDKEGGVQFKVVLEKYAMDSSCGQIIRFVGELTMTI